MAKPKILLVDADVKSRQMLEISLKKGGFTVTSCEEGEKALQLVETLVPDLIVSDIDLAGSMDGFLFCEVLKENPDHRRIPFVFLSKRKTVEDKIRGLELGVDDYLTKPIYLKELIARVRMILEKMRQESFDQSGGDPQFQGDLSQMSVVDLLQTMEMGGKTGVVHLDHDGRQARLFCRQGRIVHAVCDNLVGERAVYRALLWNDGTFRIDFRKSLQTQETIQVPTQGLIMEGMRRLDELERLKEQLPPLDTYLGIDSQTILDEHPDRFPAKIENILAEFNGEKTLEEVVEVLPYDDLESLEIVSKLYFQGFLIEVDGPQAGDEDAGESVGSATLPPAATPTTGGTRMGGAGSTLDTQMLNLDEASRSIEEIKKKARLAAGAAKPTAEATAPAAEASAPVPTAPATPAAPPREAHDMGDDTGFELAPPTDDEHDAPHASGDVSPELELAPPSGVEEVEEVEEVEAAPPVVPAPKRPDPDVPTRQESAPKAPAPEAPAPEPRETPVAHPPVAPPPPPTPPPAERPIAKVIPVRPQDGSAARAIEAEPAATPMPRPEVATATVPTSPSTPAARRSPWLPIAAVLLLAGGAGAWFFLARPAATPEASAPRDPFELVAAAEAARAEGRVSEALRLAEQAIAGDAGLGRAHAVRGGALADLGKVDEAISALEDAVRATPTLHAARLDQIALRFARGEKPAGLADELANLALKLDPTKDRTLTLDATFLALRLAIAAEDWTTARRQVASAEAAAPDDARIAPLKAKIPEPAAPAPEAPPVAASPKPQPAAPVVRRTAAAKPGPATARAVPAAPSGGSAAGALADEGRALYRKGKLREAEAKLREAASKAPDDDDILVDLGRVLVELGEDSEALDVFSRAGRLDPRNPRVYVNLGSIYMFQGDRARARKAYETYLGLVPASAREAQEIRKVLENL